MGFGKKPVQPVHYAAPPPPSRRVDMAAHEHELEARSGGLEAKLRKCDQDLAMYKKEMQRLKPGTSQYNMYKQRALRVLKQKRVYEKQMAQTGNQQFNMDQMKFAKESVADAKASVQMMQEANKTMKKDMASVDVSQVEELHDDMEEMLMDANDIGDMLGRTYDLGDGITDADLEAELDGVEEELFDGIGIDSSVPSYLQPSNVPATAAAPSSVGAQPSHAPAMGMPDAGRPNF
eukprot:CAMPEP_0185850516 /NCGR_PEP_ID=MMETSP1354-20130828/4625_1 /TAXON_ID=708628 /ORGANISM="Erythrolobus madagascarensis, Strain CCMP3276" /LENGTH=233 /DNA_ID=CAMNT_0028551207 /DNA_START=104 /DNA_END=805 /DNA_ORIENTATION=-